MAYQHGRTNGRALTEADRAAAARRAQELAAEIRQLEAIHERLSADVAVKRAEIEAEHAAAKAELSKAREALTKTIRECDLVRLQACQVKAAAAFASTLPEPLYGGHAGLEAATRELIEHETRKKATGAVVTLPKRAAHPKAEAEYRHGSKNRYRAGCRCVACRTWKAGNNTHHRKQVAA